MDLTAQLFLIGGICIATTCLGIYWHHDRYRPGTLDKSASTVKISMYMARSAE